MGGEMGSFGQALGSIPGGRVLDVATGRAGFVALLAGHLQTYAGIVGIDHDGHSLSRAQGECQRDCVWFAAMDAGRQAFADASFDTVALSAALHHLEDVPAVLAEMKRVLRPGGHFVVAEMHRDAHTEAQVTMVALHDWAGRVDSHLGDSHRPSLTRGEIVEIVHSLRLSDITVTDVAETGSDPCDEEAIAAGRDAIERYLGRAEGIACYEVFAQEARELREHLDKVGLQAQPKVVVTGRKPR
jgi:SAM-dependent methyltransferase